MEWIVSNWVPVIQWVTPVILCLTLVAVVWYAWEARRMAIATKDMAEATQKMLIEEEKKNLHEEMENHVFSLLLTHLPNISWSDQVAIFKKEGYKEESFLSIVSKLVKEGRLVINENRGYEVRGKENYIKG